jgi:5-hydroxyisourate hydrolase
MTLSTHVLDLARGLPARKLEVALYRVHESGKDEIARASTNEQGRIDAPFGGELSAGTYELVFQAGAYFSASTQECFYETIPIRFTLRGQAHYHVPLLLSPWGYSTYRGS